MNELPLPEAITPSRVVVLLVDDQPMVAEALRRALVHELDIVFHYCGEASGALNSAIATRPTVILQDLVLPGVDGLTLVQAYRNNPEIRDVPIIVLSTKEEAGVKSSAFAAGANDYLVKLPDSIELIARIRYHSRSYVALLQRDEAYRALRMSQQMLLETNLELQRLTNSDGLTGLANRRYFDEYLSIQWQHAMREGSEVAMLMIDVDHFKTYNDTYGHVAGDTALQRVGTALVSSTDRPSDLAARFGGEEFSLVLPGTSPGGARLIAERVRRSIQALEIAHSGSSTAPVITVSIGAASLVPKRGMAATQLIEIADRALYDAKHAGRNRVVVGLPAQS